jgi:HTH-type transcriptional regulator / antitoxin HigA
MSDILPIEPRLPGKWVEDELEARGWSQVDLAEIIGRPAQLISEVISGKRGITPETAEGLADAFGTSPELWMNLETRYQLAKSRAGSGSAAKATRVRRARLYTYPVREMVKRGWIEPSSNVEVMEHQIEAFFGAPLDQIQHLGHAPKKADYSKDTPSQLAWLYRAKTLATTLDAERYSDKALHVVEQRMRGLMHEPIEIRHIPKMLANAGVRFVVVEALAGSKIDGACFWLDSNRPVIAMSVRHDRIDNFWFVLRHEIEHVLRKDGQSGNGILDIDVIESVSGDLPQPEKIANKAAQEYCVPKIEMERFIARFRPLY